MKPRVSTPILGGIVAMAVAVLASGFVFLRPKDRVSQEQKEDERYAASLGVYSYYEDHGFRRDKVELGARFKKVIKEASERAARKMPPDQGEMGRCHAYDAILQRILREDYGIKWRTRREMNPDVCID